MIYEIILEKGFYYSAMKVKNGVMFGILPLNEFNKIKNWEQKASNE